MLVKAIRIFWHNSKMVEPDSVLDVDKDTGERLIKQKQVVKVPSKKKEEKAIRVTKEQK
jgi:hypothetical protein